METKEGSPPETAEEDPPEAAEPRPLRRPPLDEHGMERPRFLLDFPDDPALDRLITAFEAGNFALIRREAEKLAASTLDPDVRVAALELRRRIDPDPLAKYLLAISLVLFVVLTVWAYAHDSH